jgi:tRNA (cmo5U34)-methyltransferase
LATGDKEMNEKTGWETDEAARRFQKVAGLAIPGRTDVFSIAAELIALFSPGRAVILDLGCGYGGVTEVVLQKVPDASAVLIDFSDEMIRLSEERFRDNPEIKIIKHDLNRGIPDSLETSSFDAVVSCFVLHHIDIEKRFPLYTEILKVLKPGGVFVNGDRFLEESPKINEWMFDTWMRWVTDRVTERSVNSRTFEQIKARQLEIDRDFGDKPGSLWTAENELRQAGFTNVDCLYKNQIVAVVAAVK